MSEAKTVELEPDGQETITYPVDDQTDTVLVSLRSSEHDDITTIPTWLIDDQHFPESKHGVEDYSAQLEPLGDVLKLKIRNQDSRETQVTVGLREKKLA